MKILPDVQRQSDIKFFFAKSLAYPHRIAVISILLISGILLQLFLSFWIGFILLGIATFLSLVKGYENKPVITGEEKWSQVTPDEYKKVKAKQAQIKRWDLDFFDITNVQGIILFLAVAVIWYIILNILSFSEYRVFAPYWQWDCLVLFLPHWVTGVKTFLKQDKLIIKINILEEIMEFLSSPSDIQVLPMLATSQTKEKTGVPTDARLMVRFLNAPDYFLGMQIQISINSVEGKDYPYLYCVLIAKEEAGLFRDEGSILLNKQRGLVFEIRKSDNADVLVIRQETSANSGYYTNIVTSKHIVNSTLEIGRKLLFSTN